MLLILHINSGQWDKKWMETSDVNTNDEINEDGKENGWWN